MINSLGKLIIQTSLYRKQKKKKEPARACFNVSCQWNEGNRLKKNRVMPNLRENRINRMRMTREAAELDVGGEEGHGHDLSQAFK